MQISQMESSPQISLRLGRLLIIFNLMLYFYHNCSLPTFALRIPNVRVPFLIHFDPKPYVELDGYPLNICSKLTRKKLSAFQTNIKLGKYSSPYTPTYPYLSIYEFVEGKYFLQQMG